MITDNWYEMQGCKGHVGSRKTYPIYVYVKAKDAMVAIGAYFKSPFIKKRSEFRGKKYAPDPKSPRPHIRMLNPEEQNRLEKIIDIKTKGRKSIFVMNESIAHSLKPKF